MTTIERELFASSQITFKCPIELDLLERTKNYCEIILNLFKDEKNNKDFFDKSMNIVDDGYNIILKIQQLIDESPNSYTDFKKKIDDSLTFRKFNNCLSKLETFIQSSPTGEVQQDISKLNDELETLTKELNELFDKWKSGRTRWDGKVKKKFKAFGKMAVLNKNVLPSEKAIKSYDISKNIEQMPVVVGSKNHVTKGLYVGFAVAIKKIGCFEHGDQKLFDLKEELDYIKKLKCYNILHIYGIFRQGVNCNIVSQWAENLQTYLSENLILESVKKLSIARGIADALKFIHERDILHYDISSHNIYLDDKLQPKLHNFRIVKESPAMLTSTNEPTDPRWTSPEKFRGEEYTKASEIYSFSLVLWEIINHKIPYHDINPEEIKTKVLNGVHPQPKETNGTPIKYQEIMEKGWDSSPKKRPKIEEMLGVLFELEGKEKSWGKICRIGDVFGKSDDSSSDHIETFNQSDESDEDQQEVPKLNEPEISINERTKWNGKVKKKFKALGKMAILRKHILPTEKEIKSHDISRIVEQINPPVVFGSKNHVTKGLYADTIRVVLKKFGKFEEGDPKLFDLKKELDFIKKLHECGNILDVYGISRQGVEYSVVLQWAEYNLQTYLSDNLDLELSKKLSIARGIANALKFIHEKDILHYDIRSHNIYLNDIFQPKLHNFRIAKESPAMLTSTHEPTDPRWTPPEKFRGEEYTKASEIYSFSLVLWEIINHKTPYHDINPEEVKAKVLDGMHPQPKETKGTPIKYQEIMEKGWNPSPKQRPIIEEMFGVLNELEKTRSCKISRIGDVVDNSDDDPTDKNQEINDELEPPTIKYTKWNGKVKQKFRALGTMAVLRKNVLSSEKDNDDPIDDNSDEDQQEFNEQSGSKRWSGIVKKKFYSFGAMVVLRKTVLPAEKAIKVHDISKNVEKISPPVVAGSKNHVTKGLYVGSACVAIKKIGSIERGDPKLLDLKKELEFIKKTNNCANTLYVYGILREDVNYSVISQWAEYNLQTYLSENLNLELSKKLSIAHGIASALNYIHKRGILHRDIRSHNIYLNDIFRPKLHNFRIVKESPVMLASDSEPTDPRWTPPEKFRGEKYTRASEIYCFSLVLWEIINHKTPYHNINLDEVEAQVLKGTPPKPKKTSGTPIKYQEIMEKGWNLSPKQRPTTGQMLNVLDELEGTSAYNISKIKVVVDIPSPNSENSKKFPILDSPSSNTFLSPISLSSNNFLSPNSANRDDDACSISSINTDCSADNDYISPAGLTGTERSADIEEAIKLHKVGNHSQAWEKIQKAKNSKTTDANFLVGYYYLKGFHGGKPNANKGVEYLCQAAKDGHPDAQYHYAVSILDFGSIAKEHRSRESFKIASDFLDKATKQDHPLALRKFGSIIKKGQYGNKKDVVVGKEMMRKSRAMTLKERSSFEARPTNRLSRHITVG